MPEKVINFGGSLSFYSDYRDLKYESWITLCSESQKAVQLATATYSQFNVGAALLLDNDIIVTGANHENAVYPLGLCAERVALFTAATQYPNHSIKALAVATAKELNPDQLPPFPCGSCRQVMHEFEGNQKMEMLILVVGSNNSVCKITGTDLLLPFAFNGDSL